MAESIPKYRPGTSITCHASADVVGARCVAITGAPVDGNPRVGPPGAGARCFGVTATDATSGNKVGVHAAPGQVIPIEAGAGGVAAAAIVEATATGVIITRAAGIPVGEVVEGAAAGAQALVRWLPALL